MSENINGAYLRIGTPYGQLYDIMPNGDIIRLDIRGFQASGQWKMLGLKAVNGREYIPFPLLNAETISSLKLSRADGTPRYTVRDLDHRSVRDWGNTKHHGVRSIYVFEGIRQAA